MKKFIGTNTDTTIFQLVKITTQWKDKRNFKMFITYSHVKVIVTTTTIEL